MALSRRSFLALLAAIPLAPLGEWPSWSSVRPVFQHLTQHRLPTLNQTMIRAAFGRPEWPDVVIGTVLYGPADPPDLMVVKWVNFRNSIVAYLREQHRASAAAVQQVDDLLSPYCVDVPAQQLWAQR